MRSLTKCALWITVFAMCTGAFAADVKLEVSANRDSVYLGESVILTVRVGGTTDPPAPDTSRIRDARVSLLGSRGENWSKTTIINGRMTRSSFSGRIFTYEFTPTKPGTVTAGPFVLEAEGRKLAAAGPTIRVSDIQEQDTVVVRILSSRDSVLVDESFQVTLSVAIRTLPGRFADADPLDPTAPPSLSVPYLDGPPIEGLEAPDVMALLQRKLERRREIAGFNVNDIATRRDPFDLNTFFNTDEFRGRKKAKFRFDRHESTLNGQPYFEYRFTTEYVPKKEGDYTFGPAVFKGRAAVSAEDGEVKGMDFFAVGPARTVRVVPPPEEGRPPTYIGAIGTNLQVDVSLDTQACNVGDPLTLTLRVSGDLSMDNLRPPDLGLQPGLGRDFKVYGEPVKTAARDGAREYVYTVRPTTAGTIELPPIELAYYDTRTRAYSASRSRPVPIRVNEGAQVGYEIIIDASAGRLPVTEGDEAIVVAPLDVNPAGALPRTIGPAPWHAAALSMGPAAYLLALALRRMRRRSPQRRSDKRKRQAAARAAAGIRALETSGDRDRVEVRHELALALAQYAGARFGIASSSLTPADMKAVLLDNGVDEETAEEFRTVFDRAFRAAYNRAGPDEDDPAGDCRAALRLVETIESRLTPRSNSRSRSVLPVVLLLLLCARGADASEDARRSFLWQQANARMSSARTEEEFLAAADAYKELVRSGVRNGPLLYNLGLSLLQAGQHDEAIRALLAAERYTGADEDVRRNLRLAYAGREDTEKGSLPWYRYPLFWHFDMSTPVRAHVAVLAFAAVWVSLLLRFFGMRRFSGPLLAAAVLLLVLFASSALTSVYQEAHADPTRAHQDITETALGTEDSP
ncbi:MAG: BatD family protein [Lentisphaerae bacterium]|nr:BatD family protein [Lentisphaerota bacterium]